MRLLPLTLLACGWSDTPLIEEAMVSSEPSPRSPDAAPRDVDPGPARPTVMGALDEAQVEQAVLGVRPALDACAAVGRRSRPDLTGEVLVKLVVGAAGRVSRAEVRSTSLGHPPTEACVSNELAKAVFPPLVTGELAVVTYPVIVAPSR